MAVSTLLHILDGLDLQGSDSLTIINAWEQLSESEKAEARAKIATRRAVPLDYKLIMNAYNEVCKSYPAITVMSATRKKTIRARFNDGRTYQDFHKLFEAAEKSSFLKGKNGRGWKANFDWLIKDANMAKVLDGNYQDNPEQQSHRSYNLSDIENILNQPGIHL